MPYRPSFRVEASPSSLRPNLLHEWRETVSMVSHPAAAIDAILAAAAAIDD